MKKFEHLNAVAIPLHDGINPPAEKIPEPIRIDVKGREEHEAILKDTEKMLELGLDPIYERMVYLKRWGSWLNGSTNYLGLR